MSSINRWADKVAKKTARDEINLFLPLIQQSMKSQSAMCKVVSMEEDGTLTVEKPDGSKVSGVNPGSKPVGPGSTRIIGADARLL